MVSESRLQIAEHTAQGKTPKEIVELVPGINSVESVVSARKNPEVKAQVKWHRDNLFEKSRIDRVYLLQEMYQRLTQPTGPIFEKLRDGGEFLNASNLEKLGDFESRIIQQVEVEPAFVMVDGEKVTRSIVKKIRFHSPDAAMKILSKAAGFEDGVLKYDPNETGGPFRGLVLVPPKETTAPQ